MTPSLRSFAGKIFNGRLVCGSLERLPRRCQEELQQLDAVGQVKQSKWIGTSAWCMKHSLQRFLKLEGLLQQGAPHLLPGMSRFAMPDTATKVSKHQNLRFRAEVSRL